MKAAIALFLVAAVAITHGAPANQKRFIFGKDPGCVQAMCFVDPCMMAKCASNPSATCRQGCACSADFYDLSGNKVMC